MLLITLPATANAAIPGGPRPVPLRLLPGDIVGYARTAAGVQHAVRWNTRGVITDLGTLPPRNEGTAAYSINDRSVAVGYAPIKSI